MMVWNTMDSSSTSRSFASFSPPPFLLSFWQPCAIADVLRACCSASLECEVVRLSSARISQLQHCLEGEGHTSAKEGTYSVRGHGRQVD